MEFRVIRKVSLPLLGLGMYAGLALLSGLPVAHAAELSEPQDASVEILSVAPTPDTPSVGPAQATTQINPTQDTLMAGNVLRGAARGAAIGAIGGAISGGDAGQGAAIGAAVGGVANIIF
jgi:uncharacterized protein YcfJ